MKQVEASLYYDVLVRLVLSLTWQKFRCGRGLSLQFTLRYIMSDMKP